MNFCLIENINENYKLPDNYTIVALTQEVVYYLDKKNIDYITMEDFYSSGEIRGDTDIFLKDQINWMNLFDLKIKEFYPEAKKLDLNLASIYFHWIKYMVDNIILTSKILSMFVDSTNPRKILFINDNHGQDELPHWQHILHFQGVESTYSRIIPLICESRKIDFNRIIINSDNAEKSNFDLKLKLKSIFPQAIKIYHKILQYIKIVKFLFKENRNNHNPKNNALYFSTHNFIKEFSSNVIKAFIFNNKSFYNLNFPLVTSKSIKSSPDKDLIKKNENFDFSEIYNWINNKCELDVSQVLQSRFDTYIYSICPRLIHLTKAFLSYYENEKIDFIVTSHIFTLEEHAALAASKLSKNTKSIYFHHGADAYEFNSRYFTLIKNFDFYFSATLNESIHEIKNRNKDGQKKPIISHY
jgi:hypothetical protein